MNSERRKPLRWAWWIAWLVTGVAALYAEEDWRGNRARTRAAESLQARLATVEPPMPAVPGEMDFFQDPWLRTFLHQGSNSRSFGSAESAAIKRLTSQLLKTRAGMTPEVAEGLLADSEPLVPRLHALREAARLRPIAEYPKWFPNSSGSDPTFSVNYVITIAQTVALVARANVVVGRPAEAYGDVQILMRIAGARPAPGSLVERLVNLACAGLVKDTVEAGWQRQMWSREQLEEFRQFFKGHDSASPVAVGIESYFGQVGELTSSDLLRSLNTQGRWNWRMLLPRGWTLLWQADLMRTAERMMDATDGNAPDKLGGAEAVLAAHSEPGWWRTSSRMPQIVVGVMGTIPRAQQAAAKILAAEKEIEGH